MCVCTHPLLVSLLQTVKFLGQRIHSFYYARYSKLTLQSKNSSFTKLIFMYIKEKQMFAEARKKHLLFIYNTELDERREGESSKKYTEFPTFLTQIPLTLKYWATRSLLHISPNSETSSLLFGESVGSQPCWISDLSSWFHPNFLTLTLKKGLLFYSNTWIFEPMSQLFMAWHPSSCNNQVLFP